MTAYLKTKKRLDLEIDESTVVGGEELKKHKEYTLFVDIALYSRETTQIESDEIDEKVTYWVEIVGAPRIIPKDWKPDGPQLDAASVS